MSIAQLLRDAEMKIAQAAAIPAHGQGVFTREERKELITAWSIILRLAKRAENRS